MHAQLNTHCCESLIKVYFLKTSFIKKVNLCCVTYVDLFFYLKIKIKNIKNICAVYISTQLKTKCKKIALASCSCSLQMCLCDYILILSPSDSEDPCCGCVYINSCHDSFVQCILNLPFLSLNTISGEVFEIYVAWNAVKGTV